MERALGLKRRMLDAVLGRLGRVDLGKTSLNVTRDGVDYFTHSADGLNMVMTERAGRVVCLISDLPKEKLIDLASRLKF